MDTSTIAHKGDLKRVKMLVGEVVSDREKVDSNGEVGRPTTLPSPTPYSHRARQPLLLVHLIVYSLQ